MVYYDDDLNLTFGALADPTRREILLQLARADHTIGELAGGFDMTLPAVSKHVKVLERAGLARVTREGRARRVALQAAPLRDAGTWIARYRRYWEGSFDRLAKYLETTRDEEA
jgi:DNA-binding transcriptional ArsR family regulator